MPWRPDRQEGTHGAESADGSMDTYWLLSQATKANFKCVCVCPCVCVKLRKRKIEQAERERAQYESIWVSFSQLGVRSDFRELQIKVPRLQQLFNLLALSLSHTHTHTHTHMPGMSSQYTLCIHCSVPFQTCVSLHKQQPCVVQFAQAQTQMEVICLEHTHTHTHTHEQSRVKVVNGGNLWHVMGEKSENIQVFQHFCHNQQDLLSSSEVNGLQSCGYISWSGRTSSCPTVSFCLASTSSQSESSWK